jgi:ABC-type sugar transport system substrate-binding protein
MKGKFSRFAILALLMVFVGTIALSGCATAATEPVAEEPVAEEPAVETVAEEPVAEEPVAEEPAAEAYTIAVIPLSLGHPWWVRCEFGAQEAGNDLGIEIIFTAPDVEDAARQLNVFEDMINRGVDAIILAAVNAEAMAEPISDAIAQGIPVFGFDIGAPGTDTLFLASGWEPEMSGKEIGEGLAAEIGGSGKVAILTGSLGSPYLDARQAAIEAELAKYPDIEMVGVHANENDYDLALTQCEAVLQAHPDLAGFASTVTTGIPAAATAIMNAGLEGKVAVWGVAMPSQSADFVKAGIVNGALALDPGKMTYMGVKIAYDYLEEGILPTGDQDFGWAGRAGVSTEDKAAYVPSTLLTVENIDEFEF